MRVPRGARTVDLTGKTLMPGLVDTHSHVSRAWAADQSAPIQPDVSVLDAIDVRDAGFQRWRRPCARRGDMSREGLWAIAVAALVGLAVGGLCGAASGLVVARFSVPAFVATLGMLSAARGLTLLYSEGRPVPALTDGFRWIGNGDVWGVPMPVVLFALVFLASWWTLSQTRFGRHVYAAGGNPHAATVSGINVARIRFAVFVISGVLAGLAGMILAARTGSALPQAGVAYGADRPVACRGAY